MGQSGHIEVENTAADEEVSYFIFNSLDALKIIPLYSGDLSAA